MKYILEDHLCVALHLDNVKVRNAHARRNCDRLLRVLEVVDQDLFHLVQLLRRKHHCHAGDLVVIVPHSHRVDDLDVDLEVLSQCILSRAGQLEIACLKP